MFIDVHGSLDPAGSLGAHTLAGDMDFKFQGKADAETRQYSLDTPQCLQQCGPSVYRVSLRQSVNRIFPEV